MKKNQKISVSFLLVILLGLISSSGTLAQVDTQAWLKRRLSHNTDMSFYPAIAVSGSNVHVVWADKSSGSWKVYYKRSTDYGATWGKTKRITRGVGTDPAIAVSGDTIHVVWSDSTLDKWNAEIYYRRSMDNGASWGKPRRLSYIVRGSRFPAIAVSGDDVHVVWYDDMHTPPAKIFYKRSTNNGHTWSTRKLISKVDGSWQDPVIAVSGSKVHLAWHLGGEIYYKQSTDAGVSWGWKKRITHNAGSDCCPTIAVSGSNLHLAWNHNVSHTKEVFYKRSTNNGKTWSNFYVLTNTGSDSISPSIAVSGVDIHLFYLDNSTGEWELYYRRSTTNGVSWLSTMRLTYNSGHSFDTAAAAAGSYAHVVWDDKSPGNWEIFYKRSP
jgi:hypothetical protein